jgi:hypothetical protein
LLCCCALALSVSQELFVNRILLIPIRSGILK